MASVSVQVLKFGGASVGSVEALRLALARIREAATPTTRLVVVVSAMNGITDLLLETSRAARLGIAKEVRESVEIFRQRHSEIISQVIARRSVRTELESVLQASVLELEAICESVRVLRELTPRTLDGIASRGERLLARIITAFLETSGLPATYVDATEIIYTERILDDLWPNFLQSSRAARRQILPLLKPGRLVVVPGFIGTGPEGELVTLGRGGSDFSASILAKCLGARSVTLYKDVDGLMTANPQAVPDARVLPELHYREAAELAYYGAKILHPRTMAPLVDGNIPLYLRNSFNPSFSGTRVAGDVVAGGYPVKALTAIDAQALISVEGNGMMGVPGIAGRTFGALAQANCQVSMISQASSEASVCFVVAQEHADEAVRTLKQAFAGELANRLIDAIKVERPVSLIAVVGLGMAGQPGIAARVARPFAEENINIRAIAQGSSELNITLAVNQKDASRALGALHREFQLHKLRPLPDTNGRGAGIVLWGLGQIGRALSRQLLQQETYFRHDLGLQVNVVAVCDRSGAISNENGLERSRLEQLIDHKASGKSLCQFAPKSKGKTSSSEEDRLAHLWSLPLHNPVFVDCSASDNVDLIRTALEHGLHVVLANKKPLAAPQEQFDALLTTARSFGLQLRYEATVGAGLPVLDTLKKLHEAGDRVHSVLGALSGTLGYLMAQLEEGTPFSDAVRMAHSLGYTEPDPKDDLSGMDVGRKALILARTIGLRLELADITIEPLYPESFAKLSAEEFLQRLPELNSGFAERVQEAHKKKQVLRYIAQISPECVRVGLESVPEGSPMGRLKGLDNQIVLFTDRYKQNPLVVTGPGAGAEVTAAGVLNDILAVAASAPFSRHRANSLNYPCEVSSICVEGRFASADKVKKKVENQIVSGGPVAIAAKPSSSRSKKGVN